MRTSLASLLVVLWASSANVAADPWTFQPPVEVTDVHGERVFHHLESAGRRNIAVDGDTVGIVWEDDRDGTPRVYLARKRIDAPDFGAELRVSGDGEAFEPSLVAIADRRFAVAWEEDGQIRVRVIDAGRLGPVFTVDSVASMQPSLVANSGGLFLVAAERADRFSRIVLRQLGIGEDLELNQVARCHVDPEPAQDEQLYPSAVVQAGRLIVAWEDRRPGHTIIMAATSPADAACSFGRAERISWRNRDRRDGSGPMRSMPYGKGHGVSRVALAGFGEAGVFAVWADKRNFREGYDIWGAPWQPEAGFGDNERVQDDFGGVAQQWHAAIAGHPNGSLVAAWDDERDGNPSIVMSWREEGSWSDDIVLPGAGGPGDQAHPSIALDAAGNLHSAWVERETTGGPTRLRYAFGRAVAQ